MTKREFLRTITVAPLVGFEPKPESFTITITGPRLSPEQLASVVLKAIQSNISGVVDEIVRQYERSDSIG